jgi:hypothetical protein
MAAIQPQSQQYAQNGDRDRGHDPASITDHQACKQWHNHEHKSGKSNTG